MPRAGDQRIALRAAEWFLAHHRPLPWRPDDVSAPRDPYRVLVSEFMLQQTQAARAAEYFTRFIQRYPDAHALARAGEQDVLALWSGLGYYSRARNLHACAKVIADRFDGRVPDSVGDLRRLPGVGPYTAGAIASLAFRLPAPAVDANVARLLLRLDGREASPADPGELDRLRTRAASLVRAATPPHDPGLLNEALIELGATLCTPRAPACARCPLKRLCAAKRERKVDRIPPPGRSPRRTPLHCATVLVTDPDGRVLIERRPRAGLWAALWQAPTLERPDRPPTPAEARAHAGVRSIRPAASLSHATTHRDVRFDVYRARAEPPPADGRRWIETRELDDIPLSSPQRRILEMALPA